ncbi:MAG: hypothetical protein IPN59_13900 [Holophaga sp.]|nr:hypothetical protein [Holophaga sp.]
MSQTETSKPAGEGTSTEVVVKAKRRQYTADYKLRILGEAEACKVSGEIGALLRREGLYSSLLGKWREQRNMGSLKGTSEHRCGPKVDEQVVELERLQREQTAAGEVEPGGANYGCQKKVAQMLGATLADHNLDEEA